MHYTFSSYVIIGVVNTAIHYALFGLLYLALGYQSVSNGIAFFVAATFSYFMNAKFTFKKMPSKLRYCLFVGGMASISFFVGFLADAFSIYPLITLLACSAISLVAGFLFSKYIVFGRKRQ